jgi:hypothetical protein
MELLGEPVVRPNPLQWLRYTYVGTVPAKNSAWVLYDGTCRTWFVRHVARYLTLVAPIVILVMIFLPASLSLRTMSCLAAVLSMAVFYLAYTVDSIESRVDKAGYPFGTAARIREERSLDRQRAIAARNRERWNARAQRR